MTLLQVLSTYVTTGNNYGDQATPTSNTFIALNARTSEIVWKHQLLSNDVAGKPNADFGDSPQIYRLPDGRLVVGAGQKSGVYYVLDAATGGLVNQYQVLPLCFNPATGNYALGLFADSAVANSVVYAIGAGRSLTDQSIGNAELIALKGNGAGELWHFTSPGFLALSGVAVANGVVYFQVTNYSRGN